MPEAPVVIFGQETTRIRMKSQQDNNLKIESACGLESIHEQLTKQDLLTKLLILGLLRYENKPSFI